GPERGARELRGGTKKDAARRKQPVVARIEGQGRADARGESVVEEVRQRKSVENADRARRAEVRRARLCRDVVVLRRVRDAGGELRLDQRVAEGDGAADRRLGEVVVHAELVVQVDAEAERAVEEVRLEELD